MAAPHPLDPLSPDEITTAARCCLADGRCGVDPRFVWIALAEPDKVELLAGRDVHRCADVVIVDRATSITITAVVDLVDEVIVRVDQRADVHASVTVEEWVGAARVLDDSRVVEALALRGLGADARLHLEPWPYGFGDPAWGSDHRRLGRVTFFVRDHDADTAWARPVENLVVVADRVTGEVVAIIDGDPVPVPSNGFPIVDPDRSLRNDLKQLTIQQADGPSYTLEGGVLRWQGWELRVGFHPLDGLVLRDVTYDDPQTGRTRRIAWR